MGCNMTVISSQAPSIIFDGQVTVPAGVGAVPGSVWLSIDPTLAIPVGEWDLVSFSKIGGHFFSDATNGFNVQLNQYRVPTTLGGTVAGGTIINSAPDARTGIEIATALDDIHGKYLAVRIAAPAVGAAFAVQAYVTLRPI